MWSAQHHACQGVGFNKWKLMIMIIVVVAFLLPVPTMVMGASLFLWAGKSFYFFHFHLLLWTSILFLGCWENVSTSSFKFFSLVEKIGSYLCNTLWVSSPLRCGKQDLQNPAPSGGYFPPLLLVLERVWLPVGEGKKGRIHARRIRFLRTNERPNHVHGGAKMKKKKIRTPEADGVLIILDSCSKLTWVGTLENTKIWYTSGRYCIVNLYNVTRKLALGNKLAIIKVIFASPFTQSWGISFWVLPR